MGFGPVRCHPPRFLRTQHVRLNDYIISDCLSLDQKDFCILGPMLSCLGVCIEENVNVVSLDSASPVLGRIDDAVNHDLRAVRDDPWAVSYTHLDVYKRQGLSKSCWHEQHPCFPRPGAPPG